MQRDATHLDGAASILMGVAAKQSIAAGGDTPIDLDTLIRWPDPTPTPA